MWLVICIFDSFMNSIKLVVGVSNFFSFIYLIAPDFPLHHVQWHLELCCHHPRLHNVASITVAWLLQWIYNSKTNALYVILQTNAEYTAPKVKDNPHFAYCIMMTSPYFCHY
jgi:hypothetical protein